jgi:hypothetical protein
MSRNIGLIKIYVIVKTKKNKIDLHISIWFYFYITWTFILIFLLFQLIVKFILYLSYLHMMWMELLPHKMKPLSIGPYQHMKNNTVQI